MTPSRTAVGERHGAEPQAISVRPLVHGPNWKDAARRRFLAVADVLAVLCASAAAGWVQGGGAYEVAYALALTPLWVLVAKARGLYDLDHMRIRHVTLDELPALMYWVTVSEAVTALILGLLPGAGLTTEGAAALWVTALGGAYFLRSGARALWRRMVPPEESLVVGAGPLADAVERKLELETGHHLVPGQRVQRDLDQVEAAIRAGKVERVILAMHDLSEETLARVVSHCRAHGVKLSVVPPLRGMLGTAVELHRLAELPLIEFRTWDISRSTMLLKRVLDFSGAALALLIFTPALILVAIAIKLDSRGPVFFRQRRAGLGGEPFTMLKFRTMVDGAHDRLKEVVDLDRLREPVFKLQADPRVTRVGRRLRRLSLDELPQLVNVLRGEMSLVGPRPEEVWLVERYEEPQRFRLEMRPGITGPMQVHGRADLSFQERLAIEREYVESYSLRKDLRILLETVSAVIRGRGAY
jgi:exopolysaccharide biosynthesis polyprenyl glycosylphosphotransferase